VLENKLFVAKQQIPKAQPRRAGSQDMKESSQAEDESETDDMMSHDRRPCRDCGETVTTGTAGTQPFVGKNWVVVPPGAVLGRERIGT
jgi:hypothetical protein